MKTTKEEDGPRPAPANGRPRDYALEARNGTETENGIILGDFTPEAGLRIAIATGLAGLETGGEIELEAQRVRHAFKQHGRAKDGHPAINLTDFDEIVRIVNEAKDVRLSDKRLKDGHEVVEFRDHTDGILYVSTAVYLPRRSRVRPILRVVTVGRSGKPPARLLDAHPLESVPEPTSEAPPARPEDTPYRNLA